MLNVNALTPEQLRTVIRSHPTIFATLGSASAMSAEDTSRAIAKILAENTVVIDTVVALGAGCSEERAAGLGFLKWLAAVEILTKTTAAVDAQQLVGIMFAELSALHIGNGTLQ